MPTPLYVTVNAMNAIERQRTEIHVRTGVDDTTDA
jgi:hypothetical protein